MALCKALGKVTSDVTLIREGDEILKSFLHRQGAKYLNKKAIKKFSQLLNGCLAKTGPLDFAR